MPDSAKTILQVIRRYNRPDAEDQSLENSSHALEAVELKPNDYLKRAVDSSLSDRITIHEQAHLNGEEAHGVLRTNIAVSDKARADIKNTVIASAPFARGHVDCKEVVQGNAIANAIPIVEVHHPKAHVTHEASIGSVDNKQLETLMSRGLDEDQATELIIEGLLSPG